MTIEITYSPPDQYPDYSPPNYRAASSVTLRCVATGATGYLSYHWSSTCRRGCFAYNTRAQTIHKNILTSHDAGVHTCNVTDEAGNTGTNNTTMNIVGKCIRKHRVGMVKSYHSKFLLYVHNYVCDIMSLLTHHPTPVVKKVSDNTEPFKSLMSGIKTFLNS